MINFGQYYIAELCKEELEAAQSQIQGALAETDIKFPQAFAQTILAGACDYISQRSCWMLQKIFVTELHSWAANQSGDERAIFNDFRLAIGANSSEIRSRYPFLFNRVSRAIEQFVTFVSVHIEHLSQDYGSLQKNGFIDDSPLISVEFGRGDPHRNGKTTICYRFGTHDIFYKPRSLALDQLFVDIQSLICPGMNTLRCILGEAHGWQFGVSGRPEGVVAARHFYTALGQIVAIVHALCGTDIHYENIVTDAAGTPYLVDLEALFTNGSRRNRESSEQFAPFGAEKELDRRMADSVLTVGVVSLRRSREGAFSGAAQANAVETPVSREVAVDVGTSRMRLVRVQTAVEIKSPVPAIDGSPAAFAEFFEEFRKGYLESASSLLANLDHIHRLLRDVCNCSSRQVLRHTYIYSLFQSETTHPAYCTPEKTRALLGKLSKEEAAKPYLKRVLEHEIDQLLDFDVPYFSARLNQLHLDYPGGMIPHFFERTALELVSERLKRFSDEGWLEEQLEYVAAIFGQSPVRSSDELLLTPLQAADARLNATAIVGPNDQTVLWTYSPPEDMPGSEFAIAPMGPDLYTGLGGVLLYLLQRSRTGQGDSSQELLLRVVETGRRMIIERRGQLQSGAYTGAEGLMLALASAGRHFGDTKLIETMIAAFLDRESTWNSAQHDVMDGSAGLILVASSLHEIQSDIRLIEAIDRLGHSLLQAAQRPSDGVEWVLPSLGKAVTGFAHGGSGIAFALAHAARLTGDSSMIDHAALALKREDALFDKEVQLWPDTRTQPYGFTLGWCNGSAGFLLARASCWDVLDSDARERAKAAYFRSCEWITRLSDDSLCHGTSGAYLALKQVSEQLGWPFTLNAPASNGGHRFVGGWRGHPGNQGLLIGSLGAAYELWIGESDMFPLTLAGTRITPSRRLAPVEESAAFA